MIRGLDHVQIAMPRGGEAAARAFYTGLLGLPEIPKPQPLAARGGLWLQVGATQVHLGVDANFQPAQKAHPAFWVTDLESLRGRLSAAGVPVIPDEEVPGVQRFYAADPFGNRLEFIQDGQGFSQSGGRIHP